MDIAVLYRKPHKSDQGYAHDTQGRGNLKHVIGVKEALSALGHSSHLVCINVHSYEYLHSEKGHFDLAFNLCDDGFRNNSLLEAHVPAMLDILDIPYTGANFLCLATCVNKARTKEILSFHGIATPRFQVFRESNEKPQRNLRFPLIVKPLHEDASIGLRKESVVKNIKQLKQRVASVIADYKQPALVEEFIVGREVYVGILGNREDILVLPISEIIFNKRLPQTDKFCSYEAKWVKESRQCKNTPVQCPAELDKDLKQELIAIAKKAYQVLECQDYGRVDFRIDEHNRPFVLEVNPNPDISEDAGLARMAKVTGISYNQLIEQIVSFTLSRMR